MQLKQLRVKTDVSGWITSNRLKSKNYNFNDD